MVIDGEAFMRRECDGVAWYEAGRLGDPLVVVAAVSTRHGGVSQGGFSTLNLSFHVSDLESSVAENRRRFFRALGLNDCPVIAAGQVHGRRVADVTDLASSSVLPDVDGLVTNRPGVALALLFADCVPILAFDPRRRAIGLGHAGWRGTLAGVAGQLVRTMGRAFGTEPGDLRLAIGPSIGACCYVVGRDVAEAFRRDWPDGDSFLLRDDDRWRLDLREANRRQLLLAGASDSQVGLSDHCTSCCADEFFSHRAQGGAAGRFAAVLALRSED